MICSSGKDSGFGIVCTDGAISVVNRSARNYLHISICRVNVSNGENQETGFCAI